MDNLTVSLTMWGDLRDDYNWLAWSAKENDFLWTELK